VYYPLVPRPIAAERAPAVVGRVDCYYRSCRLPGAVQGGPGQIEGGNNAQNYHSACRDCDAVWIEHCIASGGETTSRRRGRRWHDNHSTTKGSDDDNHRAIEGTDKDAHENSSATMRHSVPRVEMPWRWRPRWRSHGQCPAGIGGHVDATRRLQRVPAVYEPMHQRARALMLQRPKISN